MSIATIEPNHAAHIYETENQAGGYEYVDEHVVRRRHGMAETILVVRRIADGNLYGLTYHASGGEDDGVYPWTGTTGPLSLAPVTSLAVTVTKYQYAA